MSIYILGMIVYWNIKNLHSLIYPWVHSTGYLWEIRHTTYPNPLVFHTNECKNWGSLFFYKKTIYRLFELVVIDIWNILNVYMYNVFQINNKKWSTRILFICFGSQRSRNMIWTHDVDLFRIEKLES